MDLIDSFKVDHMRLLPGIYISRVDETSGDDLLITYDIRLRRPNFEDALTPEVIHTLEHFGSMFLRNHPEHSSHIIYFGPMGCQTGMYLIYKWTSDQKPSMKVISSLVLSMMKFIVMYSGNMPSMGFDPESCGNYSLNDLGAAKTVAANFLTLDDAFGTLMFEYPNDENSAGIETSTQIFENDKINKVLNNCRQIRQNVQIDYSVLHIDSQSDIVRDPHDTIQRSKKEVVKNNETGEISLDDMLSQIKPEDIACMLKKKFETPTEDIVNKAFPINEEAVEIEKPKVVEKVEKEIKPVKKISKAKSSKKKKKVDIAYTGDALF